MDRVGPAAIPPRKWRELGHDTEPVKALAMAVLEFAILQPPTCLKGSQQYDLSESCDTEGRSQIRTSCDLTVCPNQRRAAV